MNNEVPLEHQIIPKPLTPADEQQLAKEIAAYEAKAAQSMKLRELNPKLEKKVYRLLKSGEDPVPVAIYFRLPFNTVAKIANKVLADRGVKPENFIPEELPLYLRLAYQMARMRQDAQQVAQPARETPAE